MMSIDNFKNPFTSGYVQQYVCPEGYHFQRGEINYGRVVWLSNVEGITIEKDED